MVILDFIKQVILTWRFWLNWSPQWVEQKFNQHETLFVWSVLGGDSDFYGIVFSSIFVKFPRRLRGRRCLYQVAVLLVTSRRAVSQVATLFVKLLPWLPSHHRFGWVGALLMKSPPSLHVAALSVSRHTCLFVKSTPWFSSRALFLKLPLRLSSFRSCLSSFRSCQVAAVFGKSPSYLWSALVFAKSPICLSSGDSVSRWVDNTNV